MKKNSKDHKYVGREAGLADRIRAEMKAEHEVELNKAFTEGRRIGNDEVQRLLSKSVSLAPSIKEKDMVNHPSHYTFGKFEVIDVLMDWFPNNPLLWQVGKYIARAHHKGNTIQDLKKGRFYYNEEIKRLEKLEEEKAMNAEKANLG